MDPLQKAYDDIPYPRLCFNQTHPGRLAAIATLLGLSPAAPAGARVLELGCGGGDNLIPMAAALPQATFVGVDLSPVQIARGQAEIEALGLTNIILLAADIRAWGGNEDPYDYIIAHGLYSWVSPPVADRLMALCGALLAPHGVAYVSYNTYPGWYRTQRLREMLLYQLRQEPDRRRWPDLVREYVGFLADAVDQMAPPPEKAHGSFMGTYSSLLAEYRRSVEEPSQPFRDVLMLHDELGAENHPVYFHQFADHAARHGLQYLAEAEFPQVMPGNLPHNLGRALGRYAGSVLEMEQQMDFLRNRTFRQTLLCRKEAPLDRGLDPARLAGLGVSSRAELAAIDEAGGQVVFRGEDGSQFRTDHPLTRSAFFYLVQEAPRVVGFEELVGTAASYAYSRTPLPREMEGDVTRLGISLLQAFTYSLQLVELHGTVPPVGLAAGDRPVAFAPARRQAADLDRVVNLRHERVELDPLLRRLLPLLDGSRAREALLPLFAAAEPDPAAALDAALEWLGRAALLVAPERRDA